MDLIITLVLSIIGILLGINILDKRAESKYNKKKLEDVKEITRLEEKIKQGAQRASEQRKKYEQAKQYFIDRVNASKRIDK